MRNRSLTGWFEARDVKSLGVDLVEDAQDKVRNIQAKLLAIGVDKKSMRIIS